MSDAAILMRFEAHRKSPIVAYILWLFFGVFGAHRFYLGHVSTGVTMLVITVLSIPLTLLVVGYASLGIAVAWVVVDAFFIPGMTRSFNVALANELAMR